MRRSTRILSAVICASCILALPGCKKNETEKGYQKNPDLNTSEDIQLRIATSKETWPEMDAIITKFEEIYPNCSVVTEYVEEYTANLAVRLNQDDQKIDIFRTVNIQKNIAYKDNALNLISPESKKILDLSGTNKGLVDNFRYTDSENTQYAIPYGGEMRGMYVNVTLLNKYGLDVPTNRAELLHCCEVLYAAGYIPFQSSNGTFAQQFLYPYICSSIVNGGNYDEMYASIENINPGISEYMRDAYTFLYKIVDEGYFDYKRVEEELGYSFGGSEEKAQEFLNITKISDDTYKKNDDLGKIAFMSDTQAFAVYLDKAKSDYHSEIEYEFIVSPVGEDGGYAYLSPADGLAINNKSDHTDWALEFLNFFFTPEINTVFAEKTDKIPNTADALLKYDIPANRTCDVGQVTFSYGFYKVVTTLMLGGYADSYTEANANYRKARPDETYYYNAGTSEKPDYKEATADYISANPGAVLYRHVDEMIGMSKMNAKKYMKDNGDGTYSLVYTVDDYITRLEKEFQIVKSERTGK